MNLPIAIDFETKEIGARPDKYPPEPVGVAIWEPGQPSKYLCWGHPVENNSSFEEAKKKLSKIWNSDRQVLFHNAPFDLEVAQQWFGLPWPHWEKVHDTQIMGFLYNPHTKKLALKDLAYTLLDLPPEEQDELKDWILTNVPGARKAKTQWGKYIALAPGKLVGKYARGDVIRTRTLYDFYMPKISQEAYERERELQPYLVKATIQGVPINTRKLKKDLKMYEKTIDIVDIAIRKKLGNSNLDIDSPKQLAEAIDRKNLISEWVPTPKGGRSVSAKALQISCKDAHLVKLMDYRARLKTGLRTFGKSWLEKVYDGRLHFQWNQTTGYGSSGKNYGARTGRLSSSPNGQNLPKERPEHTLGETYPQLPHPREYIIPEKGHVLLGRDYSQQELRILAWYLGGDVLQAFVADPNLDLHSYAQQQFVEQYKLKLERKDMKTIAFGILYGMGIKGISEKLELPYNEGAKIIKGYKSLFIGLKELQEEFRKDEGILTWGDRWYDVEPPLKDIVMYQHKGKLVKREEKIQDYYYKLLNYAIQGSAAEVTKQALNNLFKAKAKETNFFITVHDEFLISTPKELEKSEMSMMNEAMLDISMAGIKMVSTGKRSARNWASMRTVK